MKQEKEIIKSLLLDTGITINGSNAWDPHIHNENFYGRVLQRGSLGLGESYMDGWWDCEKLDQFFHKVLVAELDNRVKKNWGILFNIAWIFVLNSGRKSKAFEIGEKHYDIGNDLYRAMLDKRLTYTCGYWKDAKNLDEAQEAKLDIICRKIGLQPGKRVLDIGSGWGSFIGYAAEKYGASALGVTVSKEQKKLADELYKNFPVETRLQDYRDINEKFDHVVSLGMFEHVGYKNYKTFMKKVHSMLNDDGLFLLHTIGSNTPSICGDPWYSKYIFPNAMLPSCKQIAKAAEGLFILEDWHSFGTHYDTTLMHWYRNFNEHWGSLREKYGDRFYRMWEYYLLASAGSFRSRKNQLWQIVLSKKGRLGGYTSIR